MGDDVVIDNKSLDCFVFLNFSIYVEGLQLTTCQPRK